MIFLALILIASVALYFYTTKTFNYWKERGVKHDTPIPLFGNNWKNFLMLRSLTQVAEDMYWKYPDEKIVGFFNSANPTLIVRDPDIVKRILTSDFAYFYPRGINSHKTYVEPLLRNLFFADGDLWKLLRQRMTPAFSTGKLKAMFPLVSARAERLREVLTAATTDKSETMDARDIMARYTTDFIGSVGFGIESDSLADENAPFRKLGQNIFRVTIPEFIRAALKEMFPNVLKNFHILYLIEKEVTDLVFGILKQRNYEPSGRNDFIDLMLELKKKGTIVGESIEKMKPDGTPEEAKLEMDAELIAAQVFVFFAAGFETSSSATSFTLHQLAFHPEVQKKVQDEVDTVLARYDNKICYDAVKEMTYLEWTFQEGMRMFPSLGFLIRKSVKTYSIPETDVTIGPDVSVLIPLQALHNDPQYFEEPQEFRPERFHPDQWQLRNKFMYLPFGEGPRACIGARLGLMQSIAGLAAILSRFTVEPAPETLKYPQVDPKSTIIQNVSGGLPLIFKRRELTS